MGLRVAIRSFFLALFHTSISDKIELVLNGDQQKVKKIGVDRQDTTVPDANLRSSSYLNQKSSGRSEALELLSALQRDARFIDFIKEDLASCDDTTVASVARMVHDRTAETLERFFSIRPLSERREGETIPIDKQDLDESTGKISVSARLTGALMKEEMKIKGENIKIN